ncbi:MAG: HD domain-containing protein [Planctomycetes bacterium]|nr:HD domain-containing protein [Planctomycetota bacterium]
MARHLVNELREGDQVDQVFLVAEKQLRTNRSGNLYMHLRLADRTGAVSAMVWNVTEKNASRFQSGDYARVEGAAQIYNGAVQIIASQVDRVDARTVDESDFFPLGTADIDQLARRLAEMLRGVRNFPLRNLAESFLIDEKFMSKFVAAPAGVKNHHAYRGGLLEHVVDLMELTQAVAPRYPEVDPDLLLFGAFLHDMGKIDELTYDRQLGYSDEGQLVGHLVMGVSILDSKIEETEKLSGEPFPAELAARLKHMIVSHHGCYEFGSPKLPMTLEAVVLHHLDTLDAKVRSFHQIMQEDPDEESRWTSYIPNLGRKLFKTTPR